MASGAVYRHAASRAALRDYQSRVSNLRDGNWLIMVGTLVEHGTDMDEGDVLACGNSYDGCQEAKTARALLAKWKL